MRSERKMKTLPSVWLQALICGLLFAVGETIDSKEVSALMTFKEAIFDDPHKVLISWNGLELGSDPCDWDGISCSGDEAHVTKINISGASIRGFLAPELGQLTSLQELIFHGNRLLGVIPKELSSLKSLTVLDLGKNELTGPIPRQIGKLTKAVKINLESNALTGHLPREFENLKNLQDLRLDRNRLQGSVLGMYASSVTGVCGLTQLTTADFSYNFFNGTVPKCLGFLPKVSFQGNCLEHGVVKQRPKNQCDGSSLAKTHLESNTRHRSSKPESDDEHQGTSKKPTWLLALEIVTGVMVSSLFIVALVTALQRCNSRSSLIIPWKKSSSEKEHVSVHVDSGLLKDVAQYGRQDLEVACEDFSNIIGSSPDSVVYKGNIRGGPEIAVISLCIKEENWTGFLELYYQREVADLARLNHENAGKLLGYCRESAPFTRMLVFEYASNGTLYEHLHYGEECQLSWTRRMKIIIGIARGLKYFHSEIEPPFTISELNSSAVYLTEDFSPKLVDFECWKAILARSEKYSGSFDSQGAVCILPNSLEARHLDIQGNIYAFGVLLLEIITGRPPYCKQKGSLVDWAKEYIEIPEVMSEMVDPEAKNFKAEDLKVVCEVVKLCLNPDPTERPQMNVLCDILETGIDTTFAADLKCSSLAWAEFALSS